VTDLSPGRSEDSNRLSFDERLELLSSRYRRYTLYSLALFTTPVSLARVADHVTELLFEASAEEIPDERLQVYMKLYHHHIPRLSDADVAIYNQRDDTVGVGPNAALLKPMLERFLRREFPDEIRSVSIDS
jgi:hypothetical protein